MILLAAAGVTDPTRGEEGMGMDVDEWGRLVTCHANRVGRGGGTRKRT